MNSLQTVWTTITAWDWLKIIPALTSIWVAGVATRALQTWRKQSKAERQSKLLDELIEAAHEYLNLIRSPLTMAEFVIIDIIAHEPPDRPGDRMAGAIEYIKKRGTEDSKRLRGLLDKCRSSHERLSSLGVKGQVLHVKNYALGYDSTKLVARQFGKLEALAVMIDSPSMNWDNPEVRRMLNDIISIDVEGIKRVLEEQHSVFLGFAQEAYAQIYG